MFRSLSFLPFAAPVVLIRMGVLYLVPHNSEIESMQKNPFKIKFECFSTSAHFTNDACILASYKCLLSQRIGPFFDSTCQLKTPNWQRHCTPVRADVRKQHLRLNTTFKPKIALINCFWFLIWKYAKSNQKHKSNYINVFENCFFHNCQIQAETVFSFRQKK